MSKLAPLTTEAVKHVQSLLNVYAAVEYTDEMAANVVSRSLEAVEKFPADNARRLTEVAPELLRALDELVGALNSGYVPQKDGNLLKDACAAIAKAEGRA